MKLALALALVPAPSVRVAPPAAPALMMPAAAAAPMMAPPLSAPALSAPALSPALAAPMAAPEPGPKRAAHEASKGEAEFKQLVEGVMRSDPAAVDALNALKADHLNPDVQPEKTKTLGLKPMQIPAGMLEVQAKAEDLRGMKNKEADRWLKEHSVPYLEDYKGRKRPVDHHHEARAAWEAGVEQVYAHPYFDETMTGWIAALPKDRFYAAARAMGLFYDRDQFGDGPRQPDQLPEDVRGMGDDPFRSLTWAVRKKGGFEKTAVPFAEFQWAKYFRERLKTYPTKADFDAAVAEALALAHRPEAKSLPGWTPR